MEIDNVERVIPNDILREIRELTPDFPHTITIPFQGTEKLFSLLPEFIWQPKWKSLAFSPGGPGRDLAIQVEQLMVVEIDHDLKRLSWVNSSIDAYRRCLTEFFAHAPYDDDEDSEEDVLSDYAIQIIEAMNRIDPGCANSNMFWSELAWDVSLGDWGTDLLAAEKSE